jgi:hypothetical protein
MAPFTLCPKAWPWSTAIPPPRGGIRGGQLYAPQKPEWIEWFSEGGQFMISPDADAPAEWQPGVAQCYNGGIWGFATMTPAYSLLNHLTFDGSIDLAGLSWCSFLWHSGNETPRENAYVATLDGRLLIYKIGDLITTAPGGTAGAPFKTVVVGKNPCDIDYGHGKGWTDDLFVTCRGDNAVYWLLSDGTVHGILRDSCIRDAVSVCASEAGRCFRNKCWMSIFLHLMDFSGRNMPNYRFHCGYPEADQIPVGNPLPCRAQWVERL